MNVTIHGLTPSSQVALSGGVLAHWTVSVMPEAMSPQALSCAVRRASSRVGPTASRQAVVPWNVMQTSQTCLKDDSAA